MPVLRHEVTSATELVEPDQVLSPYKILHTMVATVQPDKTMECEISKRRFEVLYTDDCLMRSRSRPSKSGLFPVFGRQSPYPEVGTRVSLIGFKSKTRQGLLEVERWNECSQCEFDVHLMTRLIQSGWKKKREEDAAKAVAAKAKAETEAAAAVQAELDSHWLPGDIMDGMNLDDIKSNTDDSPVKECLDPDQLCSVVDSKSESLSQVSTEETNSGLSFCPVLRCTAEDRSPTREDFDEDYEVDDNEIENVDGVRASADIFSQEASEDATVAKDDHSLEKQLGVDQKFLVGPSCEGNTE